MITLNKTLILAGLLCPTIAFAQINAGDVAGTEEAQILAFLEADGYTIQEVETEGMELEVEALRDGVLFDVEIDLATGQITEIERENDDADDDEDEDGEDEDGDDEDGDDA